MTGRRDRASRSRTCSHPDCHEDIAAGAEHYTSPGGCHYHLGCVSAMPEREQPTYTQSGYRPVTVAYCSTVGCGGHVWNYASGLCQRCYRNRQDRERRRREREAVNTYGANGKPLKGELPDEYYAAMSTVGLDTYKIGPVDSEI